jgi:hypothetical protein
MAVTATPNYAAATTVTMTLASLASSTADAGRQSAAIDNTAVDAMDFALGGKVTTGTSPTTGKQIEVWLAGSYDGTSFDGGLGAADAAVTPTGSKFLLKLAAIIPTTTTSNVTYTWSVASVAAIFGGAIPPKFAVFITHNTGVALNATAGNHELKYSALKYESA